MGRTKKTTSSSSRKFKQIVVEVKPQFTPAQLESALLYTEEMMERCLTPFILLGETARQVKNNEILNLEKIEIGIMRSRFIGAKKLLDILLPFLEEKDGKVNLESGGVPIEIKITGANKYLVDPDQVFYAVTQFFIPNPFNEYWEHRSEI